MKKQFLKKKVKKHNNYNKFFSYETQERQKRNFSYKNFTYSNSYNTLFTRSLFYGTIFYKSKMKYCGFNGCIFQFIDFNNCNFRGSRFKNAVFENVWFNNCELSNTVFNGAKFINVFFTNTSIKRIKGFDTLTGTPVHITQDATSITLNDELNQVLALCKQNSYILNSGTLFYKKKQSYSLKNKLKQLSKTERKRIQGQIQENRIAPDWHIHYINILRLLKVYPSEIIASGLKSAAMSISKGFSSLSYYNPYFRKAQREKSLIKSDKKECAK